MSTYAGTFVFYNAWAKNVFALARPSDTFQMLLCGPSYTPDKAMHSLLADITGEISGAGYARQTLGSVTFNESSGVARFDFSDPQFTASGGSWNVKYWVVFDATAAGSPLIAYGLVDAGGGNVAVTDGNVLKFEVDAVAFFEISVP